jgi:hypothetical protein
MGAVQRSIKLKIPLDNPLICENEEMLLNLFRLGKRTTLLSYFCSLIEVTIMFCQNAIGVQINIK